MLGSEIVHALMMITLTTYDYNTGTQLEQHTQLIDHVSYEDCLYLGTRQAYKQTEAWRIKGYANASTNVKCEIERGDA